MSNQKNSHNSNPKDPRLWKLDDPPIRNIILWGYDTISKNPSLLILYGEQKFLTVSRYDGNTLSDNVNYTKYAIFKGINGHIPPIPKVRIFKDYNDTFEKSEMFYKNDLSANDFWSWKWNKKRFSSLKIKEYTTLKGGIEIPYFEFKEYTPIEKYKKYVEILNEKNIKFPNFDLIENPIELFDLKNKEQPLFETIFDVMNNTNIYMRKKRLKELMDKKPEKETYIKLFKTGNVEFISGLFLALAKENNPILLNEANDVNSINELWSEEKYMKGLKRCASIYINTFDEEKRKNITKSIYKNVDTLIPERTQNYYNYYYYSGNTNRFKKNTYNDGKYFIDSEIKNTLQTAEILQLTEILGKVGYYFDSPKLSQCFYGEKERKKFNYYRKYIMRAINYIAEENPDKFMEIMRELLTSYKLDDSLSIYSNYFSRNHFIIFYLYYGVRNDLGYEYESDKRLLNKKGRYEYKKEIWDNHIEDVIYIAKNTEIQIIQKACYLILQDALQDNRIPKLSYSDLISLSEREYKPLSIMFNTMLMLKINESQEFDAELMTALMNGKTKALRDLATKYFTNTNGKFAPLDLVKLLKSENIESWSQLFKKSLKRLNDEEYTRFIKEFINDSDYFMDKELPESILNPIKNSIKNLKNMSVELKQKFIKNLINRFLNNKILPEFILELVEDLIFSLSYDELYEILDDIDIEQNIAISEKYLNYISIFKSIKSENVPQDSTILSVLETGKSKMVKLLIELCEKFKNKLDLKFSTLLIMLECDVYRLNELAKNVFEIMDTKNQKNFHAFILDSPVKKVYQYGLQKLDEIYQNEIPKDFIIQLLEHTAPEVKAYISNKTNSIIENMGYGNSELYIYYIKTLLYLPNKISKSKDNIYKTVSSFVKLNPNKKPEIENILLNIGSSNIKTDSERALVALAQIRKEEI